MLVNYIFILFLIRKSVDVEGYLDYVITKGNWGGDLFFIRGRNSDRRLNVVEMKYFFIRRIVRNREIFF